MPSRHRKPKDIKFDVSGALLELYEHYGHLLTGNESKDSDRADLPESEEASATSIGTRPKRTASQMINDVSETESLEAVEIELSSNRNTAVPCSRIETITTASAAVTSAIIVPNVIDVVTATSPLKPPASQTIDIASRRGYRYGQTQFFATNDQRRNQRSKASAPATTTAAPATTTAADQRQRNDFESGRMQLLADIRQRSSELHSYRCAVLQAQTDFWLAAAAALKGPDAATTLPVPVHNVSPAFLPQVGQIYTVNQQPTTTAKVLQIAEMSTNIFDCDDDDDGGGSVEYLDNIDNTRDDPDYQIDDDDN